MDISGTQILTISVSSRSRVIHTRIALHVDDVCPLYCVHIAEAIVGELHTTSDHFCKGESKHQTSEH